MSGQKTPVFSIKKAGFVIPKNKLGGSIVPLLRGAKKPGLNDSNEATKLAAKKTKWGPDLTQDPAIRKARALAYQTRLDQIMQQLETGMLDFGDAGDTESASRSPGHESYGVTEIDSVRAEQLALEKRETIGEILKLNPSYKAPPDYKPVLKEDQVSIPVKQYPGYNFVGLIFGPGGDNQKHLEKETGAKIKLFGTKAESGNKIEIKQAESNDVTEAYEEIHIHISAETFDKVDAAISVIELLITSVSENLAGGSTTSSTSTHAPSSQEITTLDPISGPAQSLSQGQLGYPNHWFPMGLPGNNSASSPGPPNPPFNAQPSNMPLTFRFNSNPPNPSLVSTNTQPYTAQPNPISVGLPRNPTGFSGPQPGPPIISQRMGPRNHGLYPPPNTVNSSASGMFTLQNPQLPTGLPNSGSFTFQPLRPQNSVPPQMVPRPHMNPMLQSPPAMMPRSFNHGFPRPLNMGQPQHHVSMVKNSSGLPGPSGFPAYQDGPGLLRNYGPNSQVPVFPGPPRPNYNNNNNSHAFASGRPLSIPGEQQLYDPFNPTSSMAVPPHLRRR